ncbi:uncharacterized protein LOC124197863 isoform X1 [Daphnia pulex]|uniref:uncharacterized protein LOC124197863 isoform X1 n=1 Tax=Daphnia pulex TaxID=6669 RepID=UPI001EDCFF3B|nr:uncharacterized protein LOC124197863 isoform X1 [Daphnia pulex]
MLFLPSVSVLLLVVVLCASANAANTALGLRAASCQQDSLTRCTDPLKVLTNNRDLGFAASQQELNTLCPKLIDGLRCIDNFTSRCLDAQHREFFHMLYAGTKQVIVDLCEDEDYQKEYLMHAPCMRDVQSGYERCAVEYQSHVREHSSSNNNQANGAAATLGGGPTVVDDPVENSKKLCCSFQNYMKCSQAVVAGTCGVQTASFTRGFLDTMAGPLIQGYCLSYEPGTEHEIDCEQPTPKVDPSLATYNNYEPSEQALDRSDGVESEQPRSVDETEFVSSRQHNQQQQQHASSSSSLLSSRGVVSSWPVLTLLLLLAPVSFLHSI